MMSSPFLGLSDRSYQPPQQHSSTQCTTYADVASQNRLPTGRASCLNPGGPRVFARAPTSCSCQQNCQHSEKLVSWLFASDQWEQKAGGNSADSPSMRDRKAGWVLVSHPNKPGRDWLGGTALMTGPLVQCQAKIPSRVMIWEAFANHDQRPTARDTGQSSAKY